MGPYPATTFEFPTVECPGCGGRQYNPDRDFCLWCLHEEGERIRQHVDEHLSRSAIYGLQTPSKPPTPGQRSGRR
ncbi:hypothetical protein HLRTI_003461 [Halorhabdus tiamatea SARL4B]|uniref:Uncharacterized protein n=1 Tax=Halorhabdus tiamatea SARL4B TaxID=1033806 RepID=F7PR23_9EURY|nr:hypothetical protein [Halorhabdus tiamatea]ERJ04583.1 hypothetical protein HLRTI_003461 [Halorhabdus tiamatea SARL4B]CCQ34931.1 hypothetical protein HTIA_p2829 [Halorhabdus tiamatea SARL4B]